MQQKRVRRRQGTDIVVGFDCNGFRFVRNLSNVLKSHICHCRCSAINDHVGPDVWQLADSHEDSGYVGVIMTARLFILSRPQESS